MTPVALLLGILVAAALFAGVLWSATRTFRTNGTARIAHAAVAVTAILGVASLSLLWMAASQVLGAFALAAGLAASALEHGAARLLPLFPALFGLALLLGLPFAGG